MKIGIVDGVFTGIYGYQEGLRRMRALGFECIDYQGFINTDKELFSFGPDAFEASLKAQRRMIEDSGLEIIQSHGPWCWPPHNATPEERAERFEKMERSILGTAIIGCKNFVIHPIIPFTTDDAPRANETWEMNLEFFGRLCEIARQHEVVICFENMPWKTFSLASPEAIAAVVKRLEAAVDQGFVVISGFISKGERAVRDMLCRRRDARFIRILPSCIPNKRFKPESVYIEPFAEERYLEIAQGNDETEFGRAACLDLNAEIIEIATAGKGLAIYWKTNGPQVVARGEVE